ncbi:MAG TPA: BlaI/MecI/CopY family transcriptional regulator [Candidatus Acidoferrales bacterium]|jgi:predicted transcriptional regulator|nr:BlaI/MecI/CopY family transcriptional regulator [Candidatus Acidoferrales bacterium]
MEKSSGMEHIDQPRAAGPRHSILEIAPLELECLSVLWPLGEGTVRDIHRALAASRPRAYTTVMTIMDRLEQKGIVARRKVGRAFLYQPKLSAEEARLKAVEKIVEGFFNGSPEALVAHLSFRGNVAAPPPVPATARVDVSSAPVAELPSRNLDERLL